MQEADGSGEVAASAVRWVAWTCRAESVLWFLLLLPIAGSFAGMLPLAFFAGQPGLLGIGLLFIIATPPVIAAGLYLFAIVFDSALNLFRSRVRPIPQIAVQDLNDFLAQLAGTGLPRISPARVHYIPNDLTLGAHVRGVLFPRVVVSGGTLVSLMKRDHVAKAMFAHELAHIAHWDRLYVGLLAVAISNAAMPLFMLAAPSLFYRYWDPYYLDRVFSHEAMMQHLFGIAFHCCIFSYFSKRREYAADYVAVRAVGEAAYMALLGKATRSHSGGFFHPTIDERIEAVRSGRKVEKPAWAVLAFATAHSLPILLLPMVDFDRSSDESMVRMAGALSVAMYFGLSEFVRSRLR